MIFFRLEFMKLGLNFVFFTSSGYRDRRDYIYGLINWFLSEFDRFFGGFFLHFCALCERYWKFPKWNIEFRYLMVNEFIFEDQIVTNGWRFCLLEIVSWKKEIEEWMDRVECFTSPSKTSFLMTQNCHRLKVTIYHLLFCPFFFKLLIPNTTATEPMTLLPISFLKQKKKFSTNICTYLWTYRTENMLFICTRWLETYSK